MATENVKAPRFGAGDIAMLVVSIVFCIGIVAFFGPCGPKDDGAWMSCHWAGQAVAGLAAVLVAISVIHAIVPDAKLKQGLAIAAIPVAVLAAVLPGNVIDLCMMSDMRCHAVMQPSALIFSILMIAAAVFDILWYRRKLDTRPRATL